jgi:beta-hydroxylase
MFILIVTYSGGSHDGSPIHSTVTARHNAFVHPWSRAPNRPFLEPADLPGLRAVTDNWPECREEGVRRMDEVRIAASSGPNDAGFHTLLQRG